MRGMKKILIFLIIVVGVISGGILSKNLSNNLAVAEGAEGEAVENDEDDESEEAAPDEDLPFAESLPEIFIKSVNPGYTVDGVQNVGEVIEIGRKNSNDLMLLAGLMIGYTNSSGNSAILVDLSKYLWTTGETFYLQLASSPGSEAVQVRYSKTLAFKAGPLELLRNGEVIDSVCWTGKDECFKPFNSANPTSLVRNLSTGEFEHVSNYTPDSGGVLEIFSEEENTSSSESSENIASQCKSVMFSEILSYYESSQSEQFVELYNNGHETVVLDGCNIRYKNKLYPLSGTVGAEGYAVRYLNDFKLTKNPATSNTLELIDTDGTVVDKLIYYNGQRKGTAYAFIGYDSEGGEIWRMTYAPTPGEPNNYQEFKICEAGKIINEATGNCVKVTSVGEKICGEGKYLNILTGRCKNLPTENTTKECKEGYYYYEKTGRCRKIQENDGADYALVPETYTESSSFVALYLVLGVVGIGLLYIIYEFRHEIGRTFRKIKRKM